MSFFPKVETMFKTSAISFDLETLDTAPTAVILTIGACIFDPHDISDPDKLWNYSFSINVDRESCMEVGLSISQETVDWWSRQSAAAIAGLTNPAPVPLREALRAFSEFVRNHPFAISSYWANSPSFDAVILQNAYKACGMPWPFKFWMERDVRTTKYLAWPSGDAPQFHVGIKHDARGDAMTQAAIVQLAHERLHT